MEGHYIIGIPSPSDGYVSTENEYCSSTDFAMKFETKEEAAEYMKKIQPEWRLQLYVLKF